jgi:hypothetical protein
VFDVLLLLVSLVTKIIRNKNRSRVSLEIATHSYPFLPVHSQKHDGTTIPCFCDLSLGCPVVDNVDGIMVCSNPMYICDSSGILSFDDDYDDDVASKTSTLLGYGL